MTDLDTNYATNAVISALCFKGQTVPGDNTIPEGELLILKNSMDNEINDALDIDSNYTDHANYHRFQKYFIKLLKRHLKDQDPVLTKSEIEDLVNRYGSIPMVCELEDASFVEPDSV